LEGIFRIYDAEVLGSTATFDTIPKTEQERLEWFEASGRKYPLLVAESESALQNSNTAAKTEILGWTRLYSWSPRPAYDRTAEMAVYVDSSAQGSGLGKKLVQELIRKAPGVGVKVIMAKISNDNEGSIKLCEKLGFKTIGIMRNCGEKFGKILDVRLMDLQLE